MSRRDKKSSKNGVLFFDSTSTQLLVKTLLNCHELLKKSLSKNPFIRGTDSVTTVNGANAENQIDGPLIIIGHYKALSRSSIIFPSHCGNQKTSLGC